MHPAEDKQRTNNPSDDLSSNSDRPLEAGEAGRAPSNTGGATSDVNHGPMGQGSDNVGRFADDGNRGAIGSRPTKNNDERPASGDR